MKMTDKIFAAALPTTTYGGSGATVIFGALSGEWIAFGGLVIGGLGLLLTRLHQNRMYRLERERLELDRATRKPD